MIGRMAQADPSIKVGSPISLKKISEGFEKMRAEREGRDSGGSSSRTRTNSTDEAALMAELLVPGFGNEEEPTPLLGFGATAAMMDVTVTDADRREASERMRQFDRNRDGFLTKEELSRFSGNPMDFDRNRDGKLSESELTVRYARRREGREEAQANDDRNRRRDDDRKRKSDPPDVFGDRKSYRSTPRSLPEGLPRFFEDKDGDRDGQVTMTEYATEWNEDVIAAFFRNDLNGDGIITVAEAMRALEMGDGASGSTYTSSSASSGSDSGSSSSDASTGSSVPSDVKPDPKLVTYAKRIITRYDKNNDSQLTPAEWESMLISPAKADANGDGRVTVEEYAIWLTLRSRK